MSGTFGGTQATDPDRDCPLCPRLVDFRYHHREENPIFFNAPVPSWHPSEAHGGLAASRLLIVGLAPGLRGANRTGRPFTGDWAGDLLYATLVKFGLAEGRYGADPADSLKLVDCSITNAVRCVPPQNKPLGAEINACRPFLLNTIEALPSLRAIVTLGKIAHDSTARTLGVRVAAVPFGHARQQEMAGLQVFSSYHCSRYNTNTNRLTPQMFEDVFAAVRTYLGSQ
ncbi:MAG: uracil-DNA glycosylase [Ahrensia sp.]|nr:uracil-DNA glycosylase [Ahrensia sp.]